MNNLFGFHAFKQFDTKPVYLIRYTDENLNFTSKAVLKVFFDKESFQNEFEMTKKLCLLSSTFVKVYKSVEDNEKFGMILENCDGGTLKQKREVCYNEQTLLFHYKSLLKALKIAHSKGITHRDISCNNFLYKGNTIKIADFGFSKKVDSSSLNTVLGTGSHRSPMQVKRQGYEKFTFNPFLDDV